MDWLACECSSFNIHSFIKHACWTGGVLAIQRSALTLRDLEMLIDSVTQAAWTSTVPAPVGIPGRVIKLGLALLQEILMCRTLWLSAGKQMSTFGLLSQKTVCCAEPSGSELVGTYLHVGLRT